MCGSRKYPYPHHGIGNSEGWGGGRGRGSEAQEIPEGKGLDGKNHFQGVNLELSMKIATY